MGFWDQQVVMVSNGTFRKGQVERAVRGQGCLDYQRLVDLRVGPTEPTVLVFLYPHSFHFMVHFEYRSFPWLAIACLAAGLGPYLRLKCHKSVRHASAVLLHKVERSNRAKLFQIFMQALCRRHGWEPTYIQCVSISLVALVVQLLLLFGCLSFPIKLFSLSVQELFPNLNPSVVWPKRTRARFNLTNLLSELLLTCRLKLKCLDICLF